MERWTLPEGWEWVKIGELVTVNYGDGLPQRARLGGSVPVYGANGIVGYHNVAITRGQTIIIGRKGSAGAVNWSDIPCWPIDTTFFIDEFPESIFPKFLYYFLQNRELEKLQQSAAIPGLNRDILRNVPIPLPYPSDPARSLAEQRRIVARLEALLGEVREMRKLQAAIEADVGRLMESALGEVFPSQGQALPEGWEWKRLEALVEMKTGFAYAKKHLVTDGQGRPHLRPFNIGIDGEIDLTEIYYISEDVITDWESYTLEPGHILFNNTNSVELVGKTALVKTRLTGAFSNHITRLIVREPAEVDPAWLTLTLRWFWQTGYFAARCNRWIGQAGFNSSMLAEMQVPIPPVAEQRRIVAHLDAVQQEVNAARRLAAHDRQALAQLEQSILAAAFRGEV